MDSNRTFARTATFVFALAAAATIALYGLIALPLERAGHAAFSLGSLLLGEAGLFVLVLLYGANRARANKTFPGYLAFGTIAILYLAAALVVILVFSLLFDVPTKAYAVIHIVLLAIAGMIAGFIAIFVRNAEEQDARLPGTALPRTSSKRRSVLLRREEDPQGPHSL